MRYIICPGHIVSQKDGDRHFIGYHDLIRLYKVNTADCIHIDSCGRGFKKLQTDIYLRPRFMGDYSQRDNYFDDLDPRLTP